MSAVGNEVVVERSRWVERLLPLSVPLGLYLVSRLVLVVSFAIAGKLAGTPFPDNLSTWDGTWFRAIALDGYTQAPPLGEQSNVAFFPLFPMSSRLLIDVTGLDWTAVTLGFNFVLGAVFTIVFWTIAKRFLTREKAGLATAFMCFFPGSVPLTMAYSEAVSLTLSAACLLCLLDKRWLFAGILAALATSARLHALALCLACASASLVAIRDSRDWKSLVAPLLSPIGLVAYLGFLWQHTGEAFVFFRVQRDGWEQEVIPGANNVENIIDVARSPLGDYNTLLRVVFLFVLLAGLYMLWKWRPRPPIPVLVYTLVTAALTITYVAGPLPRLVLASFPLVIATVHRLNTVAVSAAIGVFAGASAILAVVMSQTIWITP